MHSGSLQLFELGDLTVSFQNERAKGFFPRVSSEPLRVCFGKHKYIYIYIC